MNEIVNQLDGKVDFLICTTGTCGTLRGCADYIRENHLAIRIWAVDAVGSVIFGHPPQKRLIPGHGSAQQPELFRPDLAERCIQVSDLECVVGCRRLVKRESILAGGSSGAIVSAVSRVKQEIPSDSTCVAILADRGERYLDTIYSDAWVKEKFGDVNYLWDDNLKNED